MPFDTISSSLVGLAEKMQRWFFRERDEPDFYEHLGPLGLVWVDEGNARGVWGRFRVEIRLQPRRYAQILLRGAHPGRERALALAAHMRAIATSAHRVGPDSRLWPACGEPLLAIPAAVALERLAGSEEGLLSFDVLPDQEPKVIIEILASMAETLGWTGDDQALQTAMHDPSARVRRSAWEVLLGGWGTRAAEEALRPSVRAALHDPDPWVRALCALHADEEGDATLRQIVCDEGISDPLTLEILRRVDPGLSDVDWLGLLAREPSPLHIATRDAIVAIAEGALTERGGIAVIPGLRRLGQARTETGRAAQRALKALVARVGGDGALSLAASEGGELSRADRGDLSPADDSV